MRSGLQHVVRTVMADKKLPDALVRLFAESVKADPEAIQTTINGALEQLADGKISPELDNLVVEFSGPLSVPETDLREWLLQLGQGNIADEMWDLMRKRVTDVDALMAAMKIE